MRASGGFWPVAPRAIFGILLVTCFAATARAQSGEWKVPPPGTVIEWSEDGRPSAVKILGVNGFQVNQELLVEGQSRGFRDKYAGIQNLQTTRGDIVRFSRSKLEALWPLQVGKTTTLDVSYGQYGNSVYTIKIASYEKVTVPAGTFDAFVIDWDERVIGASAGYVGPYHYRIWWAPSLGYHVKYINEVTGGMYAGRVTRGEVTAIKTPQ